MSDRQPEPEPTAPEPASPEPPDGKPEPQTPTADDIKRLQASLRDERKARTAAEARLRQVEEQHMSEQEKAIAAAKAEGRTEAVKAAGRRLAAAEFRAAAANKIADPAAALDVLDLARFVNDDGEVDSAALGDVVDRLAAALPAPPPAKIPAGPREPEPNGDFLRQQINSRR